MDYGRLIQRSFEITWKYRALWAFGMLFALFGSGGSPINYTFNRSDLSRPGGAITPPAFSYPNTTVLAVAGAVVCVALVLALLFFILHLIARGALIGLVYELEATQREPRFRRGWDIGTKHFTRLLGIALAVNLPLAIISLLLLLVAALPMLGTLLPFIESGGRTVPPEASAAFAGGIFASMGLLCCVILVLIVVNVVIRPIYEFAVRAAVIANKPVGDSLREGYYRVRSNLGNTAFLYILVIGLGIAFGIVMIPVILLLVGVPAVLGISAYVMSNSAIPAIIVGIVLGLPIIILLFIINGFFQAFENNLWTEGYLALDRRVSPATPTTPELPSTPEPAQG